MSESQKLSHEFIPATNLIAKICQFDQNVEIERDINQKLFDGIREHRLLGLLREKNQHDFLEAKADWNSNRQRNTLLFCELTALTAAMDEAKVKVVALKGLSLLTSVYKKDWGVRAISDIDILVNPCHLQAVREWLFARSYDPQEDITFSANAHKEVWIRKTAGCEFVIEIHQRLSARQNNYMHWPVERTPEGIYRLQPNYEFIYLVHHLAFQHTFLKLFWLVDLDRYVRTHDLDWQMITHLAQGMRLRRSLDAVFYCLRTMFDNKQVPTPRHQFWRHFLSWDQLVAARSNRTNYFLLKHLLKDSMLEALSYDLGWVSNQIIKKAR